MCVCVVQLVENGGERKEALLGAGPQNISVMKTHDLKVSPCMESENGRETLTQLYLSLRSEATQCMVVHESLVYIAVEFGW